MTPKACPYCGERKSKTLDRKYLVTTLNTCGHCQLQFRHPVDSVRYNRKFYQKAYKQADGMTTDLPDEEQLALLMAENFRGTTRDAQDKIADLTLVLGGAGGSVIDYGASWGYTTYQFQRAGFITQAYEISEPRAAFGKRLGVDIVTDEAELTGGVDAFYSSHVIEHLPQIKHMFLLARRLLSEEGLFVAYCPNGSEGFRRHAPDVFHRLWGRVHPNFLCQEFYKRAFRDVPYLIGSNNADRSEIGRWDGRSQLCLDTCGNELFVFAKIKEQQF